MKRYDLGVAALFAFLVLSTQARSVSAQESGIDWEVGPAVGRLGQVAQIRVPEGYRFTGQAGTRKFMEMTQNPVSGSELGIIVPPDGSGNWFVVFEFNQIGYVKDEEKDTLDADAILKSIREGAAEGNKERRKRGWATMDILGWHTAPRYDGVTNNLTWAILGASEGSQVVNHSVRLLGRSGVMDADLVLDPTEVSAVVPDFDKLLGGFSFTTGNKYAEFKPGDKIAEYGLTALVAGGIGAAAAKSGLLGKLWKLLVFGAIAAGAAIKQFLGRVFGTKSDAEEQTQRPV